MSEDFFTRTFLGNPLSGYLWFFGIMLGAILFKKFISIRLSALIYRLFKKYFHGVDADNFILLLTRPLKLLVLVIAAYFAFDRLAFPGEWKLVPAEQFGLRMLLLKSFFSLIFISVTWTILRIIEFLFLVLKQKDFLVTADSDRHGIPLLKEGTKILVGIFSFFLMLHYVFQVNITSLVAGLGIGGLALALAAKETIENLIGSFTIFIDKPYTSGDLVKVGNITGHVEHIGFRSSKIRTAEKTLVTVPNKKMVDAETENFSLRTARRAEFTIRLVYSTPLEKLKSILSEINSLIQKHPDIDKKDFTVRFNSFGNSGLEIYIEYFTSSPTVTALLKTKEEINFGIMEIVSRNGSAFVHPAAAAQQQPQS